MVTVSCVCQDPKYRLTSRTAFRADLNWEGQLGDTNQKELNKELSYRHDTQQEGDHNTGQKETQTLYLWTGNTEEGIITET